MRESLPEIRDGQLRSALSPGHEQLIQRKLMDDE
jgi:hypothetical protein